MDSEHVTVADASEVTALYESELSDLNGNSKLVMMKTFPSTCSVDNSVD